MENNIDQLDEPQTNLTPKPGEDMVLINIDPKLTDGGLWTNGKLMVGKVKVPESVANDIQRRLDEYAEIKAKLTDIDGRVVVREKNKDVIIAKFCADPREVSAKAFSYQLGTLDPIDWDAQTPEFQEYLKSYRMNLYGR
jgi:hypothetical protein